MDVESAQYAARPHLVAEVATQRLPKCCAPRRAALETPALSDRRGSRIGWPQLVGVRTRRRSCAVDSPLSRCCGVGPRRCRGQGDQRKGVAAAGRAQEYCDQMLVLVIVEPKRKSGLSGPILGHTGHAARVRMRRLFVVPRQIVVRVDVVGGLERRRGMLGPVLGHIGHVGQMRMRHLFVVLRQMLVDDRVGNSRCRQRERGQQQRERCSASMQSGHR